MRGGIFFKKEIKSTEIAEVIITIVLLTSALATFIGVQLWGLRVKYGLDIDGFFPLIRHLLQDDRGVIDISRALFNVGFAMSLIFYSIYGGFTYVLSAYERNKSDGTLLSLMVMPVRIFHVVIRYALYGFFKTMMMTLFTLIIFCLPLFVLNPSIMRPYILFSGFEIELMVGFSALSLLSILIGTSLLWIFNGSKMVISIYRWTTMILIAALAPFLIKVGFNISVPRKIMFFVILVLILVAVVCCFLVEKCFDKEKTVLSLSK